jgi:hypothetical protein
MEGTILEEKSEKKLDIKKVKKQNNDHSDSQRS